VTGTGLSAELTGTPLERSKAIKLPALDAANPRRPSRLIGTRGANYYWPPLVSQSNLIELWHFGTARRVLTPHLGGPPFMVAIYDGDALVSERRFDDHDAATAYAVAASQAHPGPHVQARDSSALAE